MKNKFDTGKIPNAEANNSRLKFNGASIGGSAEKNSRLGGTLVNKKKSSENTNNVVESTVTGAFYSAGNLSDAPSLMPDTDKKPSKLTGTAKAAMDAKKSSSEHKCPATKITVKPVSSPVTAKSDSEKVKVVPPVKKAGAAHSATAVKKAPVKNPKPSMNPETMGQYEKFHKKRAELYNIINDASKVASALHMKNFTEKLKTVGEKISGDSFKIQIVGNFKNGKSTFINSFLGENILPAYARPCTAVINEVKYGETKKAILHFKNPIPDTLPDELSKEAADHIKKYSSSKNIPPMVIPYDKIEDYVVIPMGKNPADMLLESPYEKVELFWPLGLLRNGVEIIDSPGLNEHATRTKVTMDYISKTDAIIFVLNATSLCSMDEMSFIKNNLKAQGFDDLFFVINRFDLIPENERERMKKFAKKQLSELTSFGDDGLFFVSAKQALDGKISENRELLEASGLTVLEKSLSDFLTKNRGRLKLSTPAKSLERILTDEILGKIIPRQKDMLAIEAGDLKNRYNSIKPRLSKLEIKKKHLYERMMVEIQTEKTAFHSLTAQNTNAVLNAIPVWVKDFYPRTQLGLFPNQSKIQELAAEISCYVSTRLEYCVSEWQKNRLTPAIKENAVNLFGFAESEVRKIMAEIRKVGNEVTGGAEHGGDKSDSRYDFTSVYSFADSNEISKSLAMNAAGSSLLAFLSSVSPVAFLGVFTYLIGGSAKNKEAQINKIKNSVTAEITSNIRLSSVKYEFEVSERVAEIYTEMANKIISPIDEEIQETQNQIENAISNIEKGGNVVGKKCASLDACETKIKALCKNIDKFLSELSKI